MCITLRKITYIKTIVVSLSSILLKMISKFTCVMMRKWRSEPLHYQRISCWVKFTLTNDPTPEQESCCKVVKKGWYVKKRKYRKRCYLISDFWNNLLAEIKNAASWCIDASMYLCLHLLQIINNNDTKKIQSKKIYIKRANCAYIGQTRWICWHRNRWCFTNSIATCNDNEKKSLKAIQSKDITHIK